MRTREKIILHKKLLDKCRMGDEKAQFHIYELYYKAIYNTCFRFLRNHQEAEEIMQDSFLSAFEKIEQYEQNVAFGAWLKKIAINKSLDNLKKKKDIVKQFAENKDFEDINEDLFLEENGRTIELLRQEIEQLAEGYRIILNLYLIEGMDHDEIAYLLGIKASTSRSQLARAKKKLIEQLNQQNLIYKHGKLKKNNTEK